MTDRLSILKKFSTLSTSALQSPDSRTINSELNQLVLQYQAAQKTVEKLGNRLTVLRASLDKALQQAISARQGLPGLSMEAWIELGGEILLVPSLAFKVFGSLVHSVSTAIAGTAPLKWVALLVLELCWIGGVIFLATFLQRAINSMSDHMTDHMNPDGYLPEFFRDYCLMLRF